MKPQRIYSTDTLKVNHLYKFEDNRGSFIAQLLNKVNDGKFEIQIIHTTHDDVELKKYNESLDCIYSGTIGDEDYNHLAHYIVYYIGSKETNPEYYL